MAKFRQEENPQKSQERVVALGYHSPTEWIFVPAIVGLYDKVIINSAVYGKAVEAGLKIPSDYIYRKAVILKNLNKLGKLIPRPYGVKAEASAQVQQLTNNFFNTYPDDMRRLASGAYKAFREHELGTAKELMHPDDPHALDILSNARRWKKVEFGLRKGCDFDDVPKLRESIGHYFENCLLTPTLFREAYNPVLDWEGYAPFEEWLLSKRQYPGTSTNRIRHGTVPKVMRAICEITVPFHPVLSPPEVDRIIKTWKAFEPIRQLADAQNEAIWEQLDILKKLDDESAQNEFMMDFQEFLAFRTNALSRDVHQVTEEIERCKAKRSHKISRLIVSTVGSLHPGGGGLQQLYDELDLKDVRNSAEAKRPEAGIIMEYEKNMRDVTFGRPPLKPVCRADIEYDFHQYWDK